MSYNAVPTVSTGDTWSAANHNTYIRDNFSAGVPDIFTAAGDIVYATAANAATTLAIGTPGYSLIVNPAGDAPVWGNVNAIYSRQGGSSTDYTESGSSDYPTTGVLIQIGSKQISLPYTSANATGFTITLTTPYSVKPMIFTSHQYVSGNRYGVSSHTLDVTNTTFKLYLSSSVAGSGANDIYNVFWMAIGVV